MIVDGRTYSPDDLQKFYGDRTYPLHRKAELEARLVEPFND